MGDAGGQHRGRSAQKLPPGRRRSCVRLAVSVCDDRLIGRAPVARRRQVRATTAKNRAKARLFHPATSEKPSGAGTWAISGQRNSVTIGVVMIVQAATPVWRRSVSTIHSAMPRPRKIAATPVITAANCVKWRTASPSDPQNRTAKRPARTARAPAGQKCRTSPGRPASPRPRAAAAPSRKRHSPSMPNSSSQVPSGAGDGAGVEPPDRHAGQHIEHPIGIERFARGRRCQETPDRRQRAPAPPARPHHNSNLVMRELIKNRSAQHRDFIEPGKRPLLRRANRPVSGRS